MNILTADDEKLALENLNNAIREAEPQAELKSFRKTSEVLYEVEVNAYRPDAAFLDIHMAGINGIDLAERIRTVSPGTSIIFVTGFSEHAVDAFSIHADGYIMKPIESIRVREELDYINTRLHPKLRTSSLLKVQCFGDFEVFANGAPLVFSRNKAKELFAYLVHKKGAACSIRMLAAVLFEDSPYDPTHQSYMQTVITSMRHALHDAEADKVIIKTFGMLSVDTTLLDCDYYRFMKMEPDALNAYTGEYMSQYEWAEFTVGYLNKKSGL